MPLTKMGLNLTGLENITAPDFDIKNTSTELLNDIPTKANEVTNGFYGLIALVGLFVYLYQSLYKNEAQGGDFAFNSVRSIGIASGICSIIGLYALNFGYFVNFYHVVIFIVVSFICVGLTWKSES